MIQQFQQLQPLLQKLVIQTIYPTKFLKTTTIIITTITKNRNLRFVQKDLRELKDALPKLDAVIA